MTILDRMSDIKDVTITHFIDTAEVVALVVDNDSSMHETGDADDDASGAVLPSIICKPEKTGSKDMM